MTQALFWSESAFTSWTVILVKKLTSMSPRFSVYCSSWGKLVLLVAVKLKLIIHTSCLALLLRCRSSPFLSLSGVQLVPGGPTSGETRPAALSLFLSADNGEERSEGGLVENHVDGNVNMLGGGGGAGRKPLKSGMKELAVFREKVTEQHRQMGKGGKHHLGLEEPKKLRPPPARVREGRGWLEGWEGGQRECPGRRGREYHSEIHVCVCRQSTF